MIDRPYLTNAKILGTNTPQVQIRIPPFQFDPLNTARIMDNLPAIIGGLQNQIDVQNQALVQMNKQLMIANECLQLVGADEEVFSKATETVEATILMLQQGPPATAQH